MLEKAVRQNALVRNVASLADLPRRVRRDLPMITIQQAQAFLEVVREHRLEALFVLAITTAARQGELLGLTWDTVHMDSGLIDISWALQKVDGRVELVEPKTSSSVRSIALTDLAIAALRRHSARQIRESMYLGSAWNNDLNLVFTTPVGTPLDKDNVRKRELPPLLRAAGLSTQLTFHDLRHIAASLALGNGVSIPTVSEMLGHADAATTLRVYAHAIPGAQREAARTLDRILTG
jgi:integrase